MTLLYDEEIEVVFAFSLEEQAKKLCEFLLDYLDCPYEVELSVLITDKEHIHQINLQTRQVDRSTDVLSFPMVNYEKPGDFDSQIFLGSLSLSQETQEMILGDVVVCAEIIKEQAQQYGHSELREFSFLFVHSLLHLFGYDHIEEQDRIIMEQVQNDIMNQLNILREEE